jgi:hypothetical protein
MVEHDVQLDLQKWVNELFSQVHLQFSTFHDASVSRCDGYCAKQKNFGCLIHIHLQLELGKKYFGVRAQLNSL